MSAGRLIGVVPASISPRDIKRMTVRLTELDAALTRATGVGLAGTLAALGEPLRNRPAAAAHVGRDLRRLERGGRRQPAERVLSL